MTWHKYCKQLGFVYRFSNIYIFTCKEVLTEAGCSQLWVVYIFLCNFFKCAHCQKHVCFFFHKINHSLGNRWISHSKFHLVVCSIPGYADWVNLFCFCFSKNLMKHISHSSLAGYLSINEAWRWTGLISHYVLYC